VFCILGGMYKLQAYYSWLLIQLLSDYGGVAGNCTLVLESQAYVYGTMAFRR